MENQTHVEDNIVEEIFTDDAEVDTEIDTEEVETSDDSEETEVADVDTTQEDSTPAKPFVVKYNGSDVEVSQEEAVTLIQYGKFLEENGGIESVKWLKKQAKVANLAGVSDYLKAVQSEIDRAEVQRMVDDEDMPEERAKELIELRRKAQSGDSAEDEQYLAEVKEFNAMFPGKKIEEIPQEVFAAKKAAPEKSLSDLYLRHLHTKGDVSKSVVQKQAANKKSSIGSLAAGADKGKDQYKKFEDIILK